MPIAPNHFTFPVDKNGKSAIFLCQLSIGAFKTIKFHPANQISGNGILYFFATIYENEENCCFDEIIVKYEENLQDLSFISIPEDISQFGSFKVKNLAYAEEVSIPECDSIIYHYKLTKSDDKNKYEYIESIIEDYMNFCGFQFMGYPKSVQNCVMLESELTDKKLGWFDPNGFDPDHFDEIVQRVQPDASLWKLLISFDMMDDYFNNLCTYDGEFNSGMDGVFYLMIKQEDLDRMDFTKVISIYQCT